MSTALAGLIGTAALFAVVMLAGEHWDERQDGVGVIRPGSPAGQ
jgi:hypothetical protein